MQVTKNLYFIKDEQANHIFDPWIAENHAVARRKFMIDMARQTKDFGIDITQHYQIYHCGFFNFELGYVEGKEPENVTEEKLEDADITEA